MVVVQSVTTKVFDHISVSLRTLPISENSQALPISLTTFSLLPFTLTPLGILMFGPQLMALFGNTLELSGHRRCCKRYVTGVDFENL